jgi:hypothetical protein
LRGRIRLLRQLVPSQSHRKPRPSGHLPRPAGAEMQVDIRIPVRALRQPRLWK